MSKAVKILEAVKTFGKTLSDKDIAEMFDTSASYVYKVRTGRNTAALRKSLKVEVASKKRGRPAKPKAPISIVEASQVLMGLVRSVPNLAVSFDNNRNKLDVLWNEEAYQINIDELPQTIDCINFLRNKEPVYDNVEF